jgi:glycosyltransferase involved in cell wall biosynthesis
MSGAAGHGVAAGGGARLRVAVVYHVWPHYREAVMRAMDRSERVAYDFFGSGDALEGIRHADPGVVARFVVSPWRRRAGLLWQPAAVRAAREGTYDALIFLADPHFLSTWAAAISARMRRVPVLFWGHGWLRREGAAKRRFRAVFFKLAQRMLVYAERARRLGEESGFPRERIAVVYNSLDLPAADAAIARIESGALDSVRPQAFFADPRRPLIVCTARLTARCRFDLLVEAAGRLAQRGRPVNVLLVGDGPERGALGELATRRGVAVHFFGACYDEEVLAQLIYRSDLTVSPGKIGLTAMHSLMYGTPAVTHGDLDAQMPEVEAIEEGVTGAFFRCGDAASLADAMEDWFRRAPARQAVRDAARAAIHARWNPAVQARIIERAVLEVTGHG